MGPWRITVVPVHRLALLWPSVLARSLSTCASALASVWRLVLLWLLGQERSPSTCVSQRRKCTRSRLRTANHRHNCELVVCRPSDGREFLFSENIHRINVFAM